MLFPSKRKKIESYLADRVSSMSAFDELLRDYLNGALAQKLNDMGLSKTEIHIDWSDDYKCVEAQGKYYAYYVDVQIEETCFYVAYDRDEPDEPQEFALQTSAQFYAVLENTLARLC